MVNQMSLKAFFHTPLHFFMAGEFHKGDWGVVLQLGLGVCTAEASKW